ncbi:MAG: DUF3987 domain-containing protein [Proteobacteria bacterium]|nr:DUF3987 domain-containing protein [Pseudomonadota bacterium]
MNAPFKPASAGNLSAEKWPGAPFAPMPAGWIEAPVAAWEPPKAETVNLTVALRWARAGFNVFPADETWIPDTKNGGHKISKAPRGGISWREKATTDEGQIRTWWLSWPNALVALPGEQPTGNLVLVDCDRKPGKPDGVANFTVLAGDIGGPLVTTQSGGQHRPFRAPEGVTIANRVSKLAPGVDIRAPGGYVIAGGSVMVDGTGQWTMPEGGPEAWRNLPALPAGIVERTKKAERDVVEATAKDLLNITDDHRRFAKHDLDRLAKRMTSAAPGTLNDTLNEVALFAGHLAHLGWVSEAEAQEALLAACTQAGGDNPTKDAGTFKSGFDSGRRDAGDCLARFEAWRQFREGAGLLGDAPTGGVNSAEVFTPSADNAPQPFSFDDPVDLWGKFAPPEMPRGLLPALLEEYARSVAENQGSDMAGVAMAALATCANVIHPSITVQMKEHDDWIEAVNLWLALVGLPSTKKSPIMKSATRPLLKIEARASEAHKIAMAGWAQRNAGTKKADVTEPEPVRRRLLVDNATTEALQDIQVQAQCRLFSVQDELAALLASMDCYRNGGEFSKDRPYWLRAYDGGGYLIDRVRKGLGNHIEHNQIGVLGGIQPDKVRELANSSADDGLLQRFICITLRPAGVGQDRPTGFMAGRYAQLVDELHKLAMPFVFDGIGPLYLGAEARAVRVECEQWVHELQAVEAMDSKLASHIGKYPGIFGRLCGTFHLIEETLNRHDNPRGLLRREISGDVARRVLALIRSFILPHAAAMYRDTIAANDAKAGHVERVASAILAGTDDRILPRDLRGTRLAVGDIRAALRQLEGYGWVQAVEGSRSDSTPYLVNVVLRQKLAARVEEAKARQAKAVAAFAALKQA